MESLNTLSWKDFDVVKELGSGSFGKVHLVKKKTDQKLYAVKTVLMTRLNQKEKDSALNEVRLLASISIPNVISYKGAFFNSENQSLCLVMQYADGGDLEGMINKQFKKNNDEGFEQTYIWKLAFEIFQGLKILHKNKIIHRDIKSANIFFVNGIAKLGDLNVSKVLEGQMCQTQTGTPYYTSPEIWKGKKYGKKCDIWSTGCLLYEMCTLHPPFRAKDFPGLYRKVIVGNYDPIPKNYSQQLSDLIRMCLTVDENLRPDANDLLETTILSGMQLSLQKFRHEDEQINLIDPIKCPRVLRFLNNKLPKAKFEEKVKKTVGFVTKKQIEIDGIKNNSDGDFKHYKRVKSEKIINLGSCPDINEDTPKILKCASKNKIVLPPLQKQEEPLKFSAKRSRIGHSQSKASHSKITSKRDISIKKDREQVSMKKVGSRKVICIIQKENSMKFLPDQ